MIEPIFVAAFPVLFIGLLFAGGVALRRRQIDMDGTPPIDKNLFLLSKPAMFIPWAAMILQSLGLRLSPSSGPPPAEIDLVGPVGLRLHSSFGGTIRTGQFLQDRVRQGSHDLKCTGAFPSQPQSDVSRHLRNALRIGPLYNESHHSSRWGIRGCRSSPHRPGRGGMPAENVGRRIRGLLSSGQALHLTKGQRDEDRRNSIRNSG